MQKAAKMMEPEIGFLFQKDAQFETGLAAWDKKRPGAEKALGGYLRKQRVDWQNDLADFRNYFEHKDETDPAVYAGRYDPAQLKLKKDAAELKFAKPAEHKPVKVAKTASKGVPNMNTKTKNVVLAAVAVLLASVSFFSGQLRFSAEKAQTHSVSVVDC